MESCKYVRKNTLLAAKGGCICTPLTPLKSATVYSSHFAIVHSNPAVKQSALSSYTLSTNDNFEISYVINFATSGVVLLLWLDVTPPSVLPTLSRGNLKPAGLANACTPVGQPKIGWNSSYYDSAFVQKWPQKQYLRASNFQKLSRGTPQTLLVLHACLLIYAYIHIRHQRNPPPPVKKSWLQACLCFWVSPPWQFISSWSH